MVPAAPQRRRSAWWRKSRRYRRPHRSEDRPRHFHSANRLRARSPPAPPRQDGPKARRHPRGAYGRLTRRVAAKRQRMPIARPSTATSDSATSPTAFPLHDIEMLYHTVFSRAMAERDHRDANSGAFPAGQAVPPSGVDARSWTGPGPRAPMGRRGVGPVRAR